MKKLLLLRVINSRVVIRKKQLVVILSVSEVSWSFQISPWSRLL